VEVELFAVRRSGSPHTDGQFDVRGIQNIERFHSVPAESDGFTIATRIRFDPDEFGCHRVEITVLDPFDLLCGPPSSVVLEARPDPGQVYAWASGLVEIPSFR
jgi:hypothetical protein